MPKAVFEGATQASRAKDRQKLGTLRQLTVQPSTRIRYDKALNRFLSFLKAEGLELPARRDRLDPLVMEYIEHLWITGEGRGLAADTLASLQDYDAKIRGHLPGAWRLVKTWVTHELPNRAPPVPEVVLHGMVGWALYHGHFAFATSLLLCFYGILRTGELFDVIRSRVEISPKLRTAVVALGLTKAGKRAGVQESVTIGHDTAYRFVQHWVKLTSANQRLCPGAARWRKLFKTCIESLHLEPLELRPYSLRGGATWWFCQHGNLDRVMVLGRWQAQKTARMYLNESRAILTEMKLEPLERFLAPFRTFFLNCDLRKFETLEPLQSNRPASFKRGLGGSGKRHPSKRPASKREKKLACPLGPGQGLGCGPPGRGGTSIRVRPLPCVVDQEGGGYSKIFCGGFTVSQLFSFSDNLAAERTEKRCALFFGPPPPGIKSRPPLCLFRSVSAGPPHPPIWFFSFFGGKRHPSKRPASKREKKLACPLGPGQGLGCGPPGRGGRVSGYAPFLSVVDQEGGGYSKFFMGDSLFPNCFHL